MTSSSLLHQFLRAVVILAFVSLGAMRAGELDPKAVGFVMLDQVKWIESRNGSSASALISGDPTKEGSLYVQLMKWHPRHNSTPHYHPHDRFITVLSGTWWVATGTNYDMNSTNADEGGRRGYGLRERDSL